MKTTVVIPTYNRREFLEQAVETVRLQTYEPLETVVVDGGSTDGTREYLESLDYSALRTVYRDEPRGLSNARNAGIDAAQGEYVLFLDSDDVLYPHAAETLVGALEEQPDDYAGVFASKKLVTDRGRVKERRVPDGHMSEPTLENAKAIGGPSSALFRRKCLREVDGFDESFSAREDLDLYLRLLKEYELYGVDEFCCERRIHSGQMSTDTEAVSEATRMLAERHGVGEEDPL